MSGKGEKLTPQLEKQKKEIEQALLACKEKFEPAYKRWKETGKVDFLLDDNVTHLLWDEPFLARISRMLKKVANFNIPTAQIVFRPDAMEFVFEYNPLFFIQLTPVQRKGIIQHELYHIALGHVTTRSAEDYSPLKRNHAQDLAINSLGNVKTKLDNIVWYHVLEGKKFGQPRTGLMPGQGQYENLPGEKSMEWYLAHIPEPQPSPDDESGEGMVGIFGTSGANDPREDQFDDHDNWANSPEKNEDEDDGDGEGSSGDAPDLSQGVSAEGIRRIAEHRLREIVQNAVNESDREEIKGGRGWGTVPANMQHAIKEALKQKLDPKKVVTSFIKKSQKASRRKTMMRVNRRFPYVHPGRAVGHRSNIVLAVDNSGSVSDDLLKKFFSWMKELSKFATFTYVEFDTRVVEESITTVKQGSKPEWVRLACGGTDFNAPTEWVNERPGKFDGMIILTDMMAPEPKKCIVQRMWITDKANFDKPYFRPKFERLLCVE